MSSEHRPTNRQPSEPALEESRSRLTHQLRNVLPTSQALAGLTLGGFVTEAILISLAQPNLYAADRTTIAFGVLYLAWFWLSIGWGFEWVGRRWLTLFHHSGRCNKGFCWLGLGLVTATLVGGYAISWGLFLRSGRFANVETARFVLFNYRHLWPYLLQAEPHQLLLASGVMLTALLTLPGLLSWSLQRSTRVANPRWAAMVWLVLGLATLSVWKHLPVQRSSLRQAARQHALKNALNPGFSLYVSHFESRNEASILPTLDPHELLARSAADTYPRKLKASQHAASVIFVAIESLRHDVVHQHHQNLEITPHINRLARNGLQLTRAYAQSTHSDYADVCLVSSLYPLRTRRHHYYGPSDPWPVTRIYDLLKPLGYTTAIISSQNEAWGGMDHFLRSKGLDRFYHPEVSQAETWVASRDPGFSAEVAAGGLVAGKFPDSHTTDQAIEWIQQQTQANRPFFLSMNLQSSHFPYLMPDGTARPFQPCELASDVSFVDYPEEHTESVRNAYFNAIHECDRQVGRLVAALAAAGRLDETILVVTGENGEAFHECGQVTHAKDPVEPAIHVACVVHAPARLTPRVESYPFEHVDLVPTVLGLLGLPHHPNFQGIDILSPSRPDAAQRLTFCHVLSSLAEADSVMLGGRWKLTVDRLSGETTLYDVVNDPLQTTNQNGAQAELVSSLTEVLLTWRHRQLAYYHFPSFYLNYFPPMPPPFSAGAASIH